MFFPHPVFRYLLLVSTSGGSFARPESGKQLLAHLSASSQAENLIEVDFPTLSAIERQAAEEYHAYHASICKQ